MNPGPKRGSKKSAAHKKKIGKSMLGSKNPKYKDGRRSYRRIAGAVPNDGNVVMHVNGKSPKEAGANVKSNLKKSKGKRPGANSTSEHERSSITKKERGRLKKKSK